MFFLGKIEVNTKNIEEIEKVTNGGFFFIQTKNNTSFAGSIISINESSIRVDVVHLGIIDVPFATIKSITPRGKESSKYEFANPHPTRYFFNPSAIPLKKRHGYFQNTYFIFNNAQYGLTDNFSIGGGFAIPFFIYITPKVGFRITDKFYLGGGALLGTFNLTYSINRGNVFGIFYGTATYGNKENNISINLGWAGNNFNSSSWEWGDYPIMSLSGMKRVNTRIALVTENWFFNTSSSLGSIIFSFGVRILWEKHSIDALAISPTLLSNPIVLPGLSYVFKFE